MTCEKTQPFHGEWDREHVLKARGWRRESMGASAWQRIYAPAWPDAASARLHTIKLRARVSQAPSAVAVQPELSIRWNRHPSDAGKSLASHAGLARAAGEVLPT